MKFYERRDLFEAGILDALDVLFCLGLLILSFGVSLTIKGKALGISPWDAFHYGLFQHFGLSVGQWSILVGAVIVALTCLFTRTLPKIGAILNMVLMGMFIDFFSFLLPEAHAFSLAAVFFLSDCC